MSLSIHATLFYLYSKCICVGCRKLFFLPLFKVLLAGANNEINTRQFNRRKSHLICMYTYKVAIRLRPKDILDLSKASMPSLAKEKEMGLWFGISKGRMKIQKQMEK